MAFFVEWFWTTDDDKLRKFAPLVKGRSKERINYEWDWHHCHEYQKQQSGQPMIHFLMLVSERIPFALTVTYHNSQSQAKWSFLNGFLYFPYCMDRDTLLKAQSRRMTDRRLFGRCWAIYVVRLRDVTPAHAWTSSYRPKGPNRQVANQTNNNLHHT